MSWETHIERILYKFSAILDSSPRPKRHRISGDGTIDSDINVSLYFMSVGSGQETPSLEGVRSVIDRVVVSGARKQEKEKLLCAHELCYCFGW
jgi:hypothetical protein